MENVILIRYGEIFLKGKNKHYFEKTLFNNIKQKLGDLKYDLRIISGRFLLNNYDYSLQTKILKMLKEVCGIYTFSPCVMIDTSDDAIKDYVKTIKITDTFRVTVKRADKTFKYTSQEYGAILGGVVLDNNNCKVDLHNPKHTIFVDIRENHKTFIYYEVIDGVKGMPISTSGNGLLLLSGGIDSPVAGYLMAKRGVSVNCLHFHSYPYTSEKAKEKVIELAKIISKYIGKFRLFIVSIKEIQEQIHKNCHDEYMITIMRRFMMKIAEKICEENNFKCVITGESLGQVASQTVESITTSNSVMKVIPILRPLIAFDKEDITKISKEIGAFDTSILPYEDCCTVFLPKHPLIKPNLAKVIEEENKLDINLLIENSLRGVEIIEITNY